MAKKMPESAPDEEQGWLTSYADLMSLLSCFFMLMMAFANYDTPGVQTKARIIAESFSKTSGLSDYDFEKLQNEIAKHPDFEDRLKMTLKEGELRIVFTGSAIFPEGASNLDETSVEILDSLIEIIKNLNTSYRILIEGHADKDEALLTNQMNHWSLSAARAAGVISRFEYYGFKSEYMAAVAKGDREPVMEFKKQLKEGAAPSREVSKLNRRVVIRVIESAGQKVMNPRLNVIFREAEGDEGVSDLSLFKYDNSGEEKNTLENTPPETKQAP